MSRHGPPFQDLRLGCAVVPALAVTAGGRLFGALEGRLVLLAAEPCGRGGLRTPAAGLYGGDRGM